MESLALFPLGAVLMPGGRMPLQIFEPRYLDLITECRETDQRFGVVWIREGSDAVLPGGETMPKLVPIGTSARLVHSQLLPDGRYAVVIEGERKFRLLSTRQEPNLLVRGDVEWLPAEPVVPLPEDNAVLQGVLGQLASHPQAEELSFRDKLDNASDLGNLLAQILPLAEADRFTLLAETDPSRRLHYLLELLQSGA